MVANNINGQHIIDWMKLILAIYLNLWIPCRTPIKAPLSDEKNNINDAIDNKGDNSGWFKVLTANQVDEK